MSTTASLRRCSPDNCQILLAGMPLATLYTQALAFPVDLPLVLPGPLPDAPADATAPFADAAALRAWLDSPLPLAKHSSGSTRRIVTH
ncbi:MAG: hypothetical protein JXR84_05835 [Anaerolineae bacterium]|nr:hypothetical protein [Anaerolineae bacterium]